MLRLVTKAWGERPERGAGLFDARGQDSQGKLVEFVEFWRAEKTKRASSLVMRAFFLRNSQKFNESRQAKGIDFSAFRGAPMANIGDGKKVFGAGNVNLFRVFCDETITNWSSNSKSRSAFDSQGF